MLCSGVQRVCMYSAQTNQSCADMHPPVCEDHKTPRRTERIPQVASARPLSTRIHYERRHKHHKYHADNRGGGQAGSEGNGQPQTCVSGLQKRSRTNQSPRRVALTRNQRRKRPPISLSIKAQNRTKAQACHGQHGRGMQKEISNHGQTSQATVAGR